MKPMTLPLATFTDGTKVAIFDLSIENLDERRERRLIAESKALATRVLKLASISRLETIIRNRERIKYNGKDVAVRYEDNKFDKPIGQKCTQKNPTQTTQATANT